jgi:hypothetical protein
MLSSFPQNVMECILTSEGASNDLEVGVPQEVAQRSKELVTCLPSPGGIHTEVSCMPKVMFNAMVIYPNVTTARREAERVDLLERVRDVRVGVGCGGQAEGVRTEVPGGYGVVVALVVVVIAGFSVVVLAGEA